MKFEYYDSLLDQILDRDNLFKLKSVYVSREEYLELLYSAMSENLLDDEMENYMTIKRRGFRIYLEE